MIKTIKLNNKYIDAYYNRGLSKYYLKRYEESIKDYDEAIRLNPKYSIAYYNRGLSKYYLKRYEESIKDYDEAIRLNPKYSIAYNNRGLSKYYLKQYKEAIGDFDKAIEIKHDFKEAHNNRGLSKAGLKQYKEAIKDYGEAIRLNPKYSIAYYNRGLSKYYLKRYEESIKDYDETIKLNPKYSIAYYNRGLSKAGLKQYKEAIKDYNKAIKGYNKIAKEYNKGVKFNKEYSIVYNNRGVSKYYLKQYKRAIKDYDEAIKLNPKYSTAYNNRGVSEHYLKQYKEAIKDYSKAIKYNSKYLTAYNNRGISKYYSKQYEEAIKDFNINAKLNEIGGINYINKIVKLFSIKDDIFAIDSIFSELIKNKYDYLWKNDHVLKLLKGNNKYKIQNKLTKTLLLYQYLLLKSLLFSNMNDKNNNIEISHYTSLKILLLLLNDKKEYKENKEDEGKIRIVNISNANDPKEGKILESIFNKNGLDIKLKSDENLITLQTSFSKNKDSLTMFRLYGKNENKEATGICLVIDKEYFNDNPYQFSPPIQISLTNEKINLYWILYYNEKENKLIFNPKYSKYENIIINLDNIEKLKSKYDTKKGKTTLNDKKEIIEYIFSNIYHYTKELDKKIKNKKLKNEIFSNLFENIKYLIKDEAFFEEQELRMLITTNYEYKLIEMDNNNKRLYINYMKLFDENDNYINEIILGSKVENAESIVEFIKKILNDKYKDGIKKKDIKVSISKAPLR